MHLCPNHIWSGLVYLFVCMCGMACNVRDGSSTLPKLSQTTGPSSHYLAAPDLFRLWSVRWRRPQLRPGSGRVENVRYGLLGLALTTTTTLVARSFQSSNEIAAGRLLRAMPLIGQR